MMNEKLDVIVNACYSSVIGEVIANNRDLQGELTAKISSLGQSALNQLHDYCSKPEADLDGLSVDDVCLLTSALSKQENPNIDALARKAVYAQKYLDILKEFDRSDSTDHVIDVCIEKICAIFPKDTEGRYSAIAHFIDSRAIGLEKIPIDYLRAAIPYIRIALIRRPNKILDGQLHEILRAGKNIEFLEIKESMLTALPCLPKCKLVYLLDMLELVKIDPLPECNTFNIQRAFSLVEIESLPKCISFKCVHTPTLDTIPLDMRCRNFSVLGGKDSTENWPTLKKIPPLINCINPEIVNCYTTDGPLILHDLQISDSKDFTKKTGRTADCIGFRQTTFGRIYIFKMKDEFNYLKLANSGLTKEERSEILKDRIAKVLFDNYPAIEPHPNQIKLMIRNGLRIDPLKDPYSLGVFGYKYYEDEKTSEIYFTAPSSETLESCWEQVREQYPLLPELKIQNSEGIATNSTFIKSFLDYDVILSNEKEFLHDQFTHVLITMQNMINPEYLSQRNDIKNIIIKCKDSIDVALENSKISYEEYACLEHMLGYFVDLCSADLNTFYLNFPIKRFKIGSAIFFKPCFLHFLKQINLDDDIPEIANKELLTHMRASLDLWKKAI